MDEMDRFRPKNLNSEKRIPYKGNRNPSPQEFAAKGYATLKMADPTATYGNTPERPDGIAEDVEFNRRWIRRL